MRGTAITWWQRKADGHLADYDGVVADPLDMEPYSRQVTTIAEDLQQLTPEMLGQSAYDLVRSGLRAAAGRDDWGRHPDARSLSEMFESLRNALAACVETGRASLAAMVSALMTCEVIRRGNVYFAGGDPFSYRSAGLQSRRPSQDPRVEAEWAQRLEAKWRDEWNEPRRHLGECRALLREAAELDPKNALARSQLRPFEIEVSRWLSVRAVRLVNDAHRRWKGMLEDARSHLHEAVELDETNDHARRNLKAVSELIRRTC